MKKDKQPQIGPVIDCAAFLRRPEKRATGTLIIMRPGVTSYQVIDLAAELGMEIRYATREETNGRGGAIFIVIGPLETSTK